MFPPLLAASSRNLGKKRDQPPANRTAASAAPPLTAPTTSGRGSADCTASRKPACQKHRAPPPEKTTASMVSGPAEGAPSSSEVLWSGASCTSGESCT